MSSLQLHPGLGRLAAAEGLVRVGGAAGDEVSKMGQSPVWLTASLVLRGK